MENRHTCLLVCILLLRTRPQTVFLQELQAVSNAVFLGTAKRAHYWGARDFLVDNLSTELNTEGDHLLDDEAALFLFPE